MAAEHACWTCEGCGVSASRLDGAPAPLPANWSSDQDGNLCLACRRQRASEVAAASAPPDSDRDTRARLRRSGLIEFEVRRSPERPDSSIARACRSSVPAVAAARRRLRLDPSPRPGSNTDRGPAYAVRRG